MPFQKQHTMVFTIQSCVADVPLPPFIVCFFFNDLIMSSFCSVTFSFHSAMAIYVP